jgi:hypothetical protein
VYGVQSAPVSEAPPAPMAMKGIFLAAATLDMAMLTPVFDPPSTMVNPF